MASPLPSFADAHGVAQRRCDALATDFIATSAVAVELGERAASREIDTLHALAASIAGAVADWRGLCAPLELSGTGFDAARARALVMEAVFDEVLSPPAWRLVNAAAEAVAEAVAVGRPNGAGR